MTQPPEQLSGGFFLEAGSRDGETHSDSLHFELNHGWTVILTGTSKRIVPLYALN